MNLKEYFESTGIKPTFFAKKCCISIQTLYALINAPKDVMLSIALRIQRETGGKVKCVDCLPYEYLDKIGPKRKKKTGPQKKTRENKEKIVEADKEISCKV